jgi:AAA15 family ATPase/GTPase
MKMLNITAIRITTYTAQEPFVFEATFKSNLNIIRGDNAKGKSTLTQSIFYVLGQEELLGSKNSKVMQSCLRKLIIDGDDNEIIVLGSSIELQIFNGTDEVTLRRCADLENVDDRLIEVTFGAALSNKNLTFRKESMYVHDTGGATNSYYGFHKWLEEFLGWELPL